MISFLVIGVEFLGDTESVHGVVVDVDERMVAVVHGGDELTELCKVVQVFVLPLLVGAIDYIG